MNITTYEARRLSPNALFQITTGWKGYSFLKKIVGHAGGDRHFICPNAVKKIESGSYTEGKKHLNSRFVDVKPTFQMSGQNQS